MELRLHRDEAFTEDYTLGKLYVDKAFFGYSLEDQVRELPWNDVDEYKIPGKTAIPKGRYEIIINYSPRFKRDLPLLLDVDGFEGVRIHSGNDEDDTEGCLLIGYGRGARTVTDSRNACRDLQARIKAALDKGERVWITIE